MGIATRINSRVSDAWDGLRGRAAPAGSGQGLTWTGGPFAGDAWGSKPAPSPIRLVEAYKSLVFACARFNADGTSKVPLRLYAASGGSKGPKPRALCGPAPVDRK